MVFAECRITLKYLIFDFLSIIGALMINYISSRATPKKRIIKPTEIPVQAIFSD